MQIDILRYIFPRANILNQRHKMEITTNILNATVNSNDTVSTASPTNESTYDKTATIIYITFGIVGIVSNLFAIIVLCSSKSMRNKLVNILLINQSAIDMATSFVMAVNGPSVSNTTISYKKLHGYFYCVFWASKLILLSLMLSSAYNLLCINIERYLSIVFPIFHKTSLTKRHIYIAMALTWLFGPLEKCLFTLPTSAVVNSECILASIWPNYTARILATVINECLNFGLPVCLTIVIYLHMAIILRRRAVNIGPTNPSATQAPSGGPQQNQNKGKMSKAATNILKTMLTLTLCYLYCWSWNSVYFSLYIAGHTQLTGSFYHFTVYTLFLNSIINPFIYTAQYKQFRQQALKLICGKESEQRLQTSITNSAN